MKNTFLQFSLYFLIPVLAGIFSVWGLTIYAVPVLKLTALKDAAISVILLSVMAWLLSNILRFYRPGSGRQWMLLAWIAILCIVWELLSVGLMRFIARFDLFYLQFISQTLWLRIFLAILLLVCVSLITWVNQQALSEARQRARFNETKQLAKEAELNSLRQQLQPHFLFNSLNSIYSLIGREPEKARKMLQQLSDFLRSTLRKDPSQTTKLEEELIQTRLYLEIEMVRFPRLHIQWNIDETCLERNIPVLFLQPLVENAIKFGLYDVRNEVIISIAVSCDKDFVQIKISNPFEPESVKAHSGTGFGLDSIRRRLYLLYGRNDLLETSAEEKLFTATIKIPHNE